MEISIAVLEIETPDRIEIRRNLVRIIDIGGLEERQPVHLGRLHQVAQFARRIDVIADENDVLHAGLRTLVDLEDDIDAAVRQTNDSIGDGRSRLARAAIEILDALDVGINDRLVERTVVLRFDLGLKLIGLDLAVALEGNAIDQVVFGDPDDDGTAGCDISMSEKSPVA